MAEFQPKEFNKFDINEGQKFNDGDGVNANAINAPIEASLYVQSLATSQPNVSNIDGTGTPSVSIEKINGLPRLKFENLKGEKGADGITPDMSNYYTKEEVDKKNRDIQKEVDNLYVITGATVTDEYQLSQAYSTRETADGNADIIDGALTRVTKIQGATVAVNGTLKNAFFKGIRSTGKNLIPFPYMFTEAKTINGVTFTPQADGGIKVNGTSTGACVRDLNNTIAKGWNVSQEDTPVIVGSKYTLTGGKGAVSVNLNASNGRAYLYISSANKTVDTVIYPMLQYGTTATEREPYKADESFMLDEAVELAKWDYIDKETKKVVKRTRIFTVDGTQSWTAIGTQSSIGALYAYKIYFSSSTLGGVQYNAVVNQKRADIRRLNLSGGNPSIGFSIIELHTDTLTTVEEVQSYFTNNPLEVAYALFKTTETDLAIPTDKYKSWVGGSETQVQGNTPETDNSADGANFTVSQDYYTQKGA